MSNKEYYLISDLHIGGDAELDLCEFEPELIAFLKELEAKDDRTELIIVGDAFGFWELTTVEGVEKLRKTLGSHKELFDQFRETGAHIAITLIPGNHDYELAALPEFAEVLAGHNIRLEPKEHITRAVAGRTIWIEHGSQRDGFNRISHFGEPHVTPIGYYVTQHVVSNAGKHAAFGKQKWLRDLESVQPNEQIPHWIFSNYFYREMSPILRYGMLPFLLLFGASIVWFVGALFEKHHIIGTDIFSHNYLKSFGIIGEVQNIIFTVNSAVISFLILFSIPFILVLWDIRKTLNRYGLKSPRNLKVQKREVYRAAAREVFASHPDVAVYVFGHTHDAFLEQIDGRAIINTGTWLKRLTRVTTIFRRMPDVYAPSFRLSYFRVYEDAGRVAIDYKRIPKEVRSGLSLLERLMVLGRNLDDTKEIPEKTILEAAD